jgi:hypothetical protein
VAIVVNRSKFLEVTAARYGQKTSAASRKNEPFWTKQRINQPVRNENIFFRGKPQKPST